MSKGTLWVKKFFESSDFFSNSSGFRTNFHHAWQKSFGRDIKIENCCLRLKRSIKKSNFWKFSFFSKSSELWTNIYRAWREVFRRYIRNSKFSFRLIRSIKKSNFWKFLFFFKYFKTSNEQLPCSAENVSAGISKLKNAVFFS